MQLYDQHKYTPGTINYLAIMNEVLFHYLAFMNEVYFNYLANMYEVLFNYLAIMYEVLDAALESISHYVLWILDLDI